MRKFFSYFLLFFIFFNVGTISTTLLPLASAFEMDEEYSEPIILAQEATNNRANPARGADIRTSAPGTGDTSAADRNINRGQGNGGGGFPFSPAAIGTAILAGAAKAAITVFAVIVGLIAFLISYITSWVVTPAAGLLNLSVYMSTQGFSDLMASGAGESLRASWKIFRDLGNIGLVFVLLYIAISTIIQAGSFQTKKLLGTTILVAILINFSYFATAVVIDVSNIMAISIKESVDKKLGDKDLGNYIFFHSGKENLIKEIKTANSIPQDQDSGEGAFSGIADSLGETDAGEGADWTDGVVKWATGYVMIAITNIVVIVVFLIASIMLITRIIILMFLLVLSPIGFVSSILPQTKKMSSEWTDALFNNAFFLPVFMLFVLVAVNIIGSGALGVFDTMASSESGIKGVFEGTVKNIIGPFVQYSIVIGLFIAALVASKKMSMGGGGIASKVSGSITTSIGKGAFTAGGFAGRNTIGRGAAAFADIDGVKDWASRSRLGALTLKGAQGVAGSSFDGRGSRAFKGVASATGFGSDFDKAGGKGGYAKSVKDSNKKYEEFSKGLGNADLNEDELQELKLQEDLLEAAKTNKEAAVAAGNFDQVEQLNNDISDFTNEISNIKNKRQSAYADQLDKGFVAGANQWIGRKNKQGAKAVRKQYQKDKDKKAIDDLKAALGNSGGGNNNDDE